MSATPALDFINHKTSKETAMDRALAAVAASGVQYAQRVNAIRSGKLAGAFGTRKDEIRAMLRGNGNAVSRLLSYRYETWDELLSDDALTLCRAKLKALRESRDLRHWTYSVNVHIALKNAYVAIRLRRFADRAASSHLMAAE